MTRGRRFLIAAGLGLLVGTIPVVLAAATPASAAAPAGYPIAGVDVSAYQGGITWSTVAAGGAKFAYIRASEQAGTPDAYFSSNYPAAKANGLFAGAYHRARPDASGGKEQADYFLGQARYVRDGRTLPPMLNLEWPRSGWGVDACYGMTPAQLTAWIRAFVGEVAARTGQLTVIYTNPNWWNPCTGNDTTFGTYPLFNSGYVSSPPAPPAGWTTWTFWQYSDSGTVPGDQDVFNGDLAGLARLAYATPFALRSHANGRYVTAENGGAASLIANRTAIGSWEQLEVIDTGDGYVALRSHANGMLVTAEKGGGSPLIANRPAIGPWEKFKLIVNADASISLLANANGRYVTAENGGGGSLIANRTAIGPWEQFDQTLAAAAGGIRWFVNSLWYLRSNPDALVGMMLSGTELGPWETFDQIDAGDGYFALRCRGDGRYVTADQAGAGWLIANRTAVGAWEKFRAVVNVDSTVSLLAYVNARYVTGATGDGFLFADSVTIGDNQKFFWDPV